MTVRLNLAAAGTLRFMLFFGLVFASLSTRSEDIPPRKFTVRATATVQESPGQIRLTWPDEGDATSYTISRRTLDSGWQDIATLAATETSFTDSNVTLGTPYEYKFVKTTPFTYTGYGYLRAGIRVPSPDQRGKIILFVENTPAAALPAELDRFQRDLTADGWTVIRRNASMNDSPPALKSQIKSIYDSDPSNIKALLLFGHLPVAYSGEISPDGHANHRGAWAADSYYADMDGSWTDHTVDITTAERPDNHNVPGDGKFDQSTIPSDLELLLGRIDLHNMTCYANKSNARSEIDLLRQYLNKNHAFRTAALPVERRALFCDNFGDKGRDPIGGSGWRTFPGAVDSNIQEVGFGEYFNAANAGSFLWSYGSGGGSYYYSTGVGTADDFALNEPRVVFTMFTGSYFGDWNNESNFLRASLGSGWILTATYSGFPHTLYFPMSLGEPIGHCILISQNNGQGGLYPPWGQGTRQIHISLHGDPTLRLHPVKPVANLAGIAAEGTATLNWNPSPDSDLLGYHVYRATSPEGPFTRLTEQPITANNFTDTAAPGLYTYMVRAQKLERTPSGTYLNPSHGESLSLNLTGTPIGGRPLQLAARRTSASQLTVTITGDPGQPFLLESSPNFSQWTELFTTTLAAPSIEIPLNIDSNQSATFLRALKLP